jgi:hypothetical protein
MWRRAGSKLPTGSQVGGCSTSGTETSCPGQLLDRLEASRAVHVLQRRELENDLLDPDAIARAMSNPPDELATLLTQFLQD